MVAPKWIAPPAAATPPKDTENTVQVPVAWSKIFFAQSYEVESWTLDSAQSRGNTTTKDNKIRLAINRGQSKAIRVRGLDAKGTPISPWNEAQTLSVPELKRLATVAPPRQPAAVENTSTEKLEKPYYDQFPSKFWTWFGTGMNFVNYGQENPGHSSASFSTIAGPSFYAEIGKVFDSNWGVMGSYKQTPGTVELAQINSADYTWNTLAFDYIRRTSEEHELLGGQFTYAALVGTQYHMIPYLDYQQGQRKYSLAKVNMMTASVGFLTQLQRAKWKYEWYMHYQLPFMSSGSTGEFKVTPIFAFDGSIGASYQFRPQWRVGGFWYGQYHQYNFESATAGGGTNAGSQTLIYSNMDLRLGYEF